MKITKTASGKSTLKISKKEWLQIGMKQGWAKTSSEWRHVQENNQGINDQRAKIRVYINAIKNSGREAEYQEILETLEASIEVLGEGYLDSGWAYDADDTRNQHPDQGALEDSPHGAGKWGTSKEDEMRAEIAQQVAFRRAEDYMDGLRNEFPEIGETLEQMNSDRMDAEQEYMMYGDD